LLPFLLNANISVAFREIAMSSVAKNSYLTALILAAAALLAATNTFFLGACLLAWMGAIRLLNSIAPKLLFPRLIHWIYAMTFEALALCAANGGKVIPVRKKTSGNGRPILMVHGYLNNNSVWRFQKRRLEALRVGPIYTIRLGNPFSSLWTHMDTMHTKVRAIAKETGRKDLILIGHSMGGLVSCLYAMQRAEPKSVTDIITIGSPFLGTPVARFFPGANAREMEPGSSLLKEIVQGIERNQTTRFYHIGSKSDQLVIPGASAVLAQNPHMLYEDLGHASFTYSTRVTEKLYEWLTNRPVGD